MVVAITVMVDNVQRAVEVVKEQFETGINVVYAMVLVKLSVAHVMDEVRYMTLIIHLLGKSSIGKGSVKAVLILS
jgi:hypothetical protein